MPATFGVWTALARCTSTSSDKPFKQQSESSAWTKLQMEKLHDHQSASSFLLELFDSSLFYQSSKLVKSSSTLQLICANQIPKSKLWTCTKKKRKLPNNNEGDEQSTARHVRMLFTADELTTSCLFSYLSKAHWRPSMPSVVKHFLSSFAIVKTVKW